MTTTTEHVDVMIIGSGFGGAVTALRLAERGVRAVMLERGRRWPLTREQNTFSTLQDPDGRSAWLSEVALLGEPKPIERHVGVLELVVGDGIVAFSGAGVGGGSLVYAGALVQPQREVFDRIFRRKVDYDEMNDVHFERVRRVVGPSPCPSFILDRPDYAAARHWLDLGHRAGLQTDLVDLAVDWRTVHAELTGERVPSVIAGDFWYGNNSGAKLSLDRNYLRRAEQSGRLEILTQHVAHSVSSTPEGRFLVEAAEIDDAGVTLRRQRFVVDRLFLAAGSIGTSQLLVRARDRGSLPELSRAVGTRWGNNGDVFSALDGFSSGVRPGRGGTAPVIVSDLGNEVAPIAVECFADWTKEAEQNSISSIGMALVPAKGSFRFDPASDSVRLTWPKDDPQIRRAVEAGEVVYRKLADAGDADCRHRRPVLPVAYGQSGRSSRAGDLAVEPTPVDATATAHPLGGVPLNHATDGVGRLPQYPGLYVVDGALLPGSAGCANPALTIAALAERNIERILDRDF